MATRLTYLEAIEAAFGADVDYAMLIKIFGDPGVTWLLQPGSTRRVKEGNGSKGTQTQAHQHVLCRTPEP